MSITIDHIIKNFSHSTDFPNKYKRLKKYNWISNKLNSINIKDDLFFLNNNDLITHKKNKNFNFIFTNFLMYYASNYNVLYSINEIKKKLSLHNKKMCLDNIYHHILFPTTNAILLNNKNNYHEYNINNVLKNHEYSFFKKNINNLVKLNFLFDDQKIHINNDTSKIYKNFLVILDSNINYHKKIELFKHDIIDDQKLLIHNVICKNNKKYILIYSEDKTIFPNKIKKWEKKIAHIVFDDYNFFHINMNISDSIDFPKQELISEKINTNNILLLKIKIFNSSNIIQEQINKTLLKLIMHTRFLFDFKTNVEYINAIFLRLKVNYRKKIAKIAIFSKDYALCVALKSSLISLKNTFDKYNFKLNSIIIENNDFFNKEIYDNDNFISKKSFFSIIIKNNKNIKDAIIHNDIDFQNKYFNSNLIDIYA